MPDPFGVRAWRQRPLRERLLPWPVYAIMSVAVLVSGVYLLGNPTDTHNPRRVGVFCLLLSLTGAYVTVLSYRVRR